ncbi:MAG: tetratricopeptide repeat protein, partial [Bacteroides sp.]|nr:tetratricopeptide repeat protein [Bacteroides sp.]
MEFLKSLFSGKAEDPETEKQKNDQKNFEIFKYDGMRAQRMGRPDYAIKCFKEALALEEDFETMSYLTQIYIQTSDLNEAKSLLEQMINLDPEHIDSYLSLANVCFLQEDYQTMTEVVNKAIEIEEGNATAHYLLGKAYQALEDWLMS